MISTAIIGGCGFGVRFGNVQTLVIPTAWDKINGGCGFCVRFGEQNVRVKFCRGRCQCLLSEASASWRFLMY